MTDLHESDFDVRLDFKRRQQVLEELGADAGDFLSWARSAHEGLVTHYAAKAASDGGPPGGLESVQWIIAADLMMVGYCLAKGRLENIR